MKIAYLSPFQTSALLGRVESISEQDVKNYPGMGGYGIVDLIINMLPGNDEIVIITLDNNLKDNYICRKGNNCSYYIVPNRNKKRFRDLFKKEREWIQRVLTIENPDIVHAHWTYEYALAALPLKKPYLITAHDNPLSCLRYLGVRYLPLVLLSIYIALLAKNFSSVSPFCNKFYSKLRRVPIKVISNPLDFNYFKTATLRKSDINALNCQPFLIMSVLGQSNLKNPKGALKAFALARNEIPSIEFHLFGHGLEQGGTIWRWAKSMAYEKGVVFHGFMDNLFVREYLQKAFVYLHTSFSEACNMGIAEAMCLGKPIIAGKYSGGVPWQLDWGQAGLLVDVSKPEEIAKALVNVIVDSDLRVKLSLNARERAKALFNPDSICREYKYLYQQIIDTRV